ncbi:MAG: DUF4175 family protein, partial [Pseudomonadota bacterium]
MATTRETDRRTDASTKPIYDEPAFRPDRATRRRLASSRRALFFERLARAFWPALAMFIALAGLTFLGLFASVPASWHLVTVGVAVLLLAAALAYGWLSFRFPARVDARSRLDESAPQGGQPLATLADRQAAGRETPFARALWLEHRRRAERAARDLRSRPANMRLADRDPWGLRLFAPVVLGAGLLAGGA